MEYNYIYISNFTTDEYNYYFSLMDIVKQQQVTAYKNENDKKRTVAGEMLARRMISTYCNVPAERISFELGLYGKPRVLNYNIEFNISHSEEMVVCCISDKPIGIDVEIVRPIGTNILRKLCTEADLKYIFCNNTSKINRLDEFDEQQLYRFYEVWTAKEAYCKCTGTGIKNLKSISMDELTERRQKYQIDNYIITIIESNN